MINAIVFDFLFSFRIMSDLHKPSRNWRSL